MARTPPVDARRTRAMLRAAMATFDLSGDWQGHYEQQGGKHGIWMHVVQRGQSFVGRMRDTDTLLASRETLKANGRTAEVEVLMTLPEHSTVEGEVEARVVTFVKSYQGKSTTNVRLANGLTHDMQVPGHQVHYLGTLDATGQVLSGHWRIPGQNGGTGLRDRFELRRVVVSAASST